MTQLIARDDVQLMRCLHRDPHGRSAKPTWEVSSALGITLRSAAQRLRYLRNRRLVECDFVRGAEQWWRLTEEGRTALAAAVVAYALDERAAAGADR